MDAFGTPAVRSVGVRIIITLNGEIHWSGWKCLISRISFLIGPRSAWMTPSLQLCCRQSSQFRHKQMSLTGICDPSFILRQKPPRSSRYFFCTLSFHFLYLELTSPLSWAIPEHFWLCASPLHLIWIHLSSQEQHWDGSLEGRKWLPDISMQGSTHCLTHHSYFMPFSVPEANLKACLWANLFKRGFFPSPTKARFLINTRLGYI